MRLIDAGAITEDERQEHGFFYNSDLQELLDEQPTIDISNTSNTLGALDCVERQAAIDVLNRGLSKIPYVNNTDEEMIRRDERMCCIQEIRGLPSVQWIPVSERLPEERDSIFAKLYGTEKWRNAMFRKTSNTVIITVEFKDGTRQTAPCRNKHPDQ